MALREIDEYGAAPTRTIAKQPPTSPADSEVFWINKICGLVIVVLRRFLPASVARQNSRFLHPLDYGPRPGHKGFSLGSATLPPPPLLVRVMFSCERNVD
jgi:hypothetical protein